MANASKFTTTDSLIDLASESCALKELCQIWFHLIINLILSLILQYYKHNILIINPTFSATYFSAKILLSSPLLSLYTFLLPQQSPHGSSLRNITRLWKITILFLLSNRFQKNLNIIKNTLVATPVLLYIFKIVKVECGIQL